MASPDPPGTVAEAVGSPEPLAWAVGPREPEPAGAGGGGLPAEPGAPLPFGAKITYAAPTTNSTTATIVMIVLRRCRPFSGPVGGSIPAASSELSTCSGMLTRAEARGDDSRDMCVSDMGGRDAGILSAEAGRPR